MISLDPVAFIIIVQTILLLIMVVAVLLFMLRAKNKKLKVIYQKKSEEDEVSPTASIEHYLMTETKVTSARYESLYKEEDLQQKEITEPDLLILRKNFLELEKELLSDKERSDEFWDGLKEKFKNLLNKSQLVKRLTTKEVSDDDEEDVQEMKKLLKAQYDEFDELYITLEGQKSEDEIKKIKEKLSSVIRSHTELSHCMYILEDENKFLREQINSLLKGED